jgi:predicted CXXCH cytochrome family protein
MSDDARKTSFVLIGLTLVFLGLAVAFTSVPSPLPVSPPIPKPPAPKPTTVRISAGQLMRSGGDASGLACYTCHDQAKPPEVKYDHDRQVILPKEHSDLIASMKNCDTCHLTKQVKLDYTPDGDVIIPKAHEDWLIVSHGRNNRNINCYNCHNPQQLDQLVTRDGTKLRLDEATLLCASCHGTTYRDWQAGVHGRTNGYWDRKRGGITRQECTSCHDPHNPTFPKIIPLPGPHLLHREAAAAPEKQNVP